MREHLFNNSAVDKHDTQKRGRGEGVDTLLVLANDRALSSKANLILYL